MKKIIALLLCVICFAGCSFSVGDMESEYTVSSFDGVWRQADHDPNEYLEAIIDGDTIEISVISKTENISAVYWYGTMPTLSKPVDDYQWVSTSDLSKISYAFVVGSDTEKHFIYKDGQIWFPYSMADTNTSYSVIMRLERVEE